ncbi:MAG: AraC family transcriptional regulator [Bacteroides sp. SM23_62_1]|nr:MAG: AraC family transcriptional regulator [Bacteroides sp. SM23_62_1]
MQDPPSMENDFLNRINEIITENISNERFGVSELAREVGMSRSNLLRKIRKLSKLSASQYIRQVRLQHAMEMLRQTSLNVSEVSYKVGFGSVSYFIKCFRDYYGYPPGEVGNRDLNERDSIQTGQFGKKRLILILGAILFVVLLVAVFFIGFKPFSSKQKDLEKSIAVLPFKNDSNDSSNVYIINGLMESILNNLQKIEDLRVISRTSVEKYRNVPVTIPEIARELNVNYFVEGSGQKIGDQILLNIQLIEASSDKHLLSEQYIKDAGDIFQLQMEVAKNIAGKIKAIITPEEEERINKVPTDDLVAYDYFLKGLDLLYKGDRESLENAIKYFETATEHDHEFALAYADLAITYYLLDLYQVEKKYSVQINTNADKALLFDPQLAQSLIAKAMFYINNKEYEQAIPHLEKALEYNPNSALVINILSDFYTSYIPDTEKYLEYALKGIGLDIAANDSITVSYIYLNISNAFIQSGFVNEAEKYINLSLNYNPGNLYSEYVKAYILFAKNRDFLQTKELLIAAFNKDTNRYDILQEIGKICYYMRDYESAFHYFKKFIEIKETQQLDIYPGENAKIGVVLSKVGLKEKSEKYFKNYLNYAEQDRSIYHHLSLAVYYSYHGETEKAIEHLKKFSQQSNYHYWVILFLEIDPLVDNIKDYPEFKRILRDIEIKFWDSHLQIKASLKEKKLL